jgi:predicted metalloprotease with PDZ domain
LRIGNGGNIMDVRWGGPADKAQLAPGEKIIAVNGRAFSLDILRGAIRAAKTSPEPIRLIVQSDSYIFQSEIDYHDGERFPVLERVDGAPVYIDDIIAPLTKQEKAPANDPGAAN